MYFSLSLSLAVQTGKMEKKNEISPWPHNMPGLHQLYYVIDIALTVSFSCYTNIPTSRVIIGKVSCINERCGVQYTTLSHLIQLFLCLFLHASYVIHRQMHPIVNRAEKLSVEEGEQTLLHLDRQSGCVKKDSMRTQQRNRGRRRRERTIVQRDIKIISIEYIFLCTLIHTSHVQI